MAVHSDNVTTGTVYDECNQDYDYDYDYVTNDSYTAEALTFLPEVTSEQRVYSVVYYYATYVILPIIFIFGIVGNTINIIIFTRSRFRRALDEIEKSAATGLVALAVSDLSFCLLGLLASFLSMPPHGATGDALQQTLALYYEAYKAPILNLFTFSSTWLVVAVAFERYVAVIYPFQARWLIRVNRTVVIDTLIYLLALLFSIPGFTKYKIHRVHCLDGSIRHLALLNIDYFHIRQGYLITWAIFGTFLPLLLLVIFNIRLVRKIHKSRARCAAAGSGAGDTLQYSASKITTILITIVLLHVSLVSPSMVISFLRLLPQVLDSSANHGLYHSMRTASTLANVAQAANFAVNFLLYCALSRPFRDHLTGQACKRSPSSRASTDTGNHRYQLVEVHI